MSAQETKPAGRQGRGLPPVLPVPRDAALPTSFAQQRLWFLEQLAPGGFSYNVPLAARLKGRLEVAALERSLEALVRRHEALRTMFGLENGRPVQRIAPEPEFVLPVESLEALPEAERASAALRRVEEEARRPFDLEHGPLFRARLLRLAAEEHVLVLSLHHIVCDGWSLGLMERELTELYRAYCRGETPKLPALPVQYPDYAVWQREWLKGEALEAQLAWWKRQLAGAPPVLELPTDRPRPAVQSTCGAVLRVELPPALSGAVREVSRKEGVTPFMTLLAGFQALLARYSGQRDVVVGTPISGRNRREVEGLMGFFANTLALRVEAPGEVSFRELLKRVREACLGAYARQDVPFERLVDALQPGRDLSRTPLFQASFVLQGAAPFAALELPGVAVEELVFEPGVAKFDVTLFVRETARGWVGLWEYNTGLYDEATVARMAAHYARLLEGALADPEQALAALPMLSEAERHQVLVEWNGRRAGYPRDTCAHHLIEATVARTPDAVAVAYEDRELTYRELNRRANQLAHHLRTLGVGPEVRVGLCLERSLEMVVGILAVLKAGGAYVPLDPAYPQERLAFMVREARMPVLVTTGALTDVLPSGGEQRVRLDVDAGVLARQPEDNPAPSAVAENLAYVIFTSGSTGRPKGTLLTHRGLCNTALAAVETRGVRPDSRVLQFAAFSFDSSVSDIFSALMAGACLVQASRDSILPGAGLDGLLKKQRVTLVTLTPSVLAQQEAGGYPKLETVISAGEACTPELVRKWKTGRRFLNEYGPTEVTVCATIDEDVRAERLTIGKPLPNVQVYVLDGGLRPVPAGVVGELYVGGRGLARGYLERPELTAERFVPNPYDSEPGARMYRTGDLARWLPGGELEYVGRADSQVKVRGFRIELGEIEAVLADHPEVKEGAVAAREDGPGGKRLVAYYVARGEAPAVSGLRQYLKERLPEHMVPSAFVRLEALPLTPSRKVDRKALPAPVLEEAREEYEAPRTAMEQVVADLWAPLLGLKRVGARDHFFELGGHSLLATQVVSRLREVLQRELPVRTLFEAPTVAELAARLESMLGDGPGLQAPPLVPTARDGVLPLSFAQQRLWFLEQLTPGGFTYNVPYFARLEGRLEVAALERSLREVVRRHEVLRTTFTQVKGEPVQRIAAQLALALPVESLEAVEEGERPQAVQRRAEEEARKPFDLEKGPLVRASLLRLSADEHVLLVVMHHIVCDGWSMGVLVKEVEALYGAYVRGEEPTLPVLPVQYGDYAKWQREWLRGGVLEGQLEWWKQRLEGAPPVLELPTDRPRPVVQSNRGALLRVALPKGLHGAVRELSRREGVTPYMTLLAALQVLLGRYSGQKDVVVGSPIAGRTRGEVEGLVGFFVNTLALRVETKAEENFRELLGRVREVCLGAYAHQEVPFEQLVEAVQPVRDLSRTPLFQVLFALQEPPAKVALPGLSLESLDIDPGMAKFDLSFYVRESVEGWEGFWEYDTALFDEETVARMAAHYVRLLEGAVSHPERRPWELPLLSEAERRQFLVEWNDTRAEYPDAGCVHTLVEAQVRRTPEAIALVSEQGALTYRELDARANQLAWYLRGLGVGPEVCVGLCVERSLEMVVGLLGILKAGGAYVPLDPTYPAERLEHMLEESQAPVVLTQVAVASRLPPGSRSVCLDSEWSRMASQPTSRPESGVTPENLVYVIYTSGSTGRPKGAMNTHDAVANRLLWMQKSYGLTSEDRVLQKTPFTFDVSVWEFFWPLLTGARLYMARPEGHRDPAYLAEVISAQGITTLHFVPSMLQMFLAHPGVERCAFRRVFCSGEELPAELQERFFRAFGAELHNLYGPTEAAVDVSFWACQRDGRERKVPIGRPIDNLQLYVLDGAMQPVPLGVAGELFIGGVGLARGYCHRPDLTAERFIPHPFSAEPGARLYRTGDLARLLADGNVEYLGRIDHQVKIRGLRVELGEIEAVITRHPAVREAVVLVREDIPGDKRLVAYVAGEGLDTAELRGLLQQRLPEFMVPSAFVVLEAMPLSANGKLNRKALPAPDMEEAREEYEAPRTPMEQVVADLWAPLLGLKRVGARDHFFELGGHSLLATQVVSRLREALKVELPVRALFEAPTVAELAARLEEALGGAQGPRPPPLVATARDGALPLSFAQQRLWFLEQLAPGGFTYNVPYFARLEGRLEVAALERSLGEVVRRHEVLRTTFTQVKGQPVQRIAAQLALALPVESLEEVGEGERPEAVQRRAEEEARKPFDLEKGPLLRAKLLRLGADEHVLLLVMHHIVCDGWSMGVLVKEVEALYGAYVRGEEPALSALPVQYGDYAKWQREWLRGEVLERQLAWWKQRLEGAPPVLELPTDRPRPAVQSHRGALLRVALPKGLHGAVRELSRREGVTPYMTLLAALQVLLGRYSGQKDVVVGSPIAGRTRGEVEGLVGFFVNTLALRVETRAEESFRELLGRVREVCLGAYAHQEVPFEQLVEAVQPVRDLSRTPLFQVLFALQESPAKVALPGLSLETMDVDAGMAKFDLSFYVREGVEGGEGFWEYDTALFDEETVARMAAHYVRLLEGAVAHPERRPWELPLLSEAEQRQLLVEWNEDRADYPREACIHHLFEAQARRTPEATAVVTDTARLTYRELEARANQLARRLRSMGVGPEVRVGLCVERNADMVVAMLAILKAGGAYVPLDPTYPKERLAWLLEDAQGPALVAHSHLLGALPPHSVPVVCLDSDSLARESTQPLPDSALAGNLAYLIYTSGSTGRPKGVAIAHQNAVAFLHWALGVFSAEELRGVLGSTSLNFDLSVFEVFAPLSCGGSVVLARNALHLAELSTAGEVTLLNTVPSAMAQLLRMDAVPASVRTVNLAGEALPQPLAEQVYEVPGVRRLYNLYGPSEDTTYSTYALVKRGEAPLIGRPITNTQAYVLDGELRPVPVSVIGELYLAGEGLARGYLHRPELTAERFLPDPFGAPGTRMYRTGDRVRYRADGVLEYLGRADFQVKVRGFRIELGEIESVLRQHPAVRDTVLLAREDGPSGKWLVAYVVPISPRPPGEEPPVVQRGGKAPRGEGAEPPGLKPEELRTWLKQKLPEYMVPSAFVVLETLPLTSNGKVDRKALPAPEGGEGRAGYVAPRTALEEVVAGIWASLLGARRVGAEDHFFELGGHSLLATQVASRLREVLKVELPVRALFESPTVAELARRLEAMSGGPRGPEAPALVPTPRDGALPLSFAQQRLWFMDRLEPGSALYNIPMAMRLEGALDVEVLERALDELVHRHESLRTTFQQGEREAFQLISPPSPLALARVDLRELPADTREQEARRLVAEEARRPFELTVGPLLRVTLLRLEEEAHVLVLVMHHIVSDGWSMGVLIRELEVLYAALVTGTESPLGALPIQYADYARWQREWLRGEVLESQLSWWRQQLEGASPVLELPADRPRPVVKTYRGALQRVFLPKALTEELRKLSQCEGVSLFMTLLAGFQALLHRYSGQDDISVGSPIAGRGRSEVEGLIGFFVNTLVLRSRFSPEASFRDLLLQVRDTTLGAYEHQDIPFEKLVEQLQPQRDPSRSPLFQVLFALQNMPIPELALGGLKSSPLESEGGISKFELSLFLQETPEGLRGVFEYNTDLFEPATIARMAEHLQVLLAAAVASPGTPVSRLPLLSEAEQHTLLVEWNDTRVDYPREACIHELFEAQAARTPDALAVQFEGQSLTYRQLDSRSNQLAHHLRHLGLRPGTPVAMCVERSLEMVVATLAILKAGGAYVPLDPSYPRERLELMLQDVQAPLLLAQRHLADRLPPNNARLVLLDAEWHLIAQESQEPVRTGVTSESLAYVMYTSGSTGRPKGVCIPHRGVVRLVMGTGFVRFGPDEIMLQLAPISFDAATLELWGSLLHGGKLVVFSPRAPSFEELGQALRQHGITTLWLTAALFDQMAATQPEALAHVRQVLAGGDVLAPERVKARLARGLLVNGYGPTESTTFATTHVLTRPEQVGHAVSIGRPISNTQVYVLDERLQPVPTGVPGELYIGGDGLGWGYLHRPELTAEKFVPHPFARVPGERLYRTGDKVRWLANGTLDFLGRLDSQVKVRGFRIELGEIESVLDRHPAVRQSVVIAREDSPGDKRLVAYVVGIEDPGLNLAELRTWLKQKLPEYMVPSAFVVLEALPLTSNGKVDRKALPAPDSQQRSSGHFVSPEAGLEQVLAAIWAEALRLERVGADDNFFDLGGNSLLLQTVHMRLEARVGRRIPLVELFQFSTVRSLATHLSGNGAPAVTAGEASAATGENRRDNLRRLALHRRGRPVSG